MPDKKKLSDMLDNLIDSNPEQARVDFHDYIGDKIADITGLESDTVPADNESNDKE